MLRLLSTGFARMFRSRLFRLGITAAAVFSLLVIAANALFGGGLFDVRHPHIDDTFFLFSSACGFFSAVFCSLFIGKKFSEGTIRNEVVAGHTKTRIYLSNLIVCTAGGWLMYLSYILVQLGVNIPLFGGFRAEIGSVFLSVLCTLLLIASFTSVFTLITMLIQNRTTAAIACILSVLILLPVGSYLCDRLEAQWDYGSYWMTDDGVIHVSEVNHNPLYVGGKKRVVYTFFRDFLPAGQAINLAKSDPEDPWQMALYSTCLVALTDGIGTVLFRRRNLK